MPYFRSPSGQVAFVPADLGGYEDHLARLQREGWCQCDEQGVVLDWGAPGEPPAPASEPATLDGTPPWARQFLFHQSPSQKASG